MTSKEKELCTHCGSDNTHYSYDDLKDGDEIWFCKRCQSEFLYSV